MHISLASSERFLPVPFARGYISALWLAFRDHTWKAYYRSAVGRFVPLTEQDHWLHFFDIYDEGKEIVPLDYTVLRLLHANMLDDGSTEAQQMQKIACSLTVPIGEAWWVGNSPLSKKYDYGLQRLLEPEIFAHLDQNTTNNIYRTQTVAERTKLAIQGFVESFARASEIGITTTHESKQVIVGIDPCPFCSQHPNCRVFWGVMLAFLIWLHKAGTISETSRSMLLDKDFSTAHSIVLNVIEQPSSVPLSPVELG